MPSKTDVYTLAREAVNFFHEVRALLDGTTLNFTLDGYFAYNFNRPYNRVNLLRAYHVSSNSFSLNQAALQSEESQKSLAANLQFAGSLGARVLRLKGRSVADAVAQAVRERHITQVIFGRSVVKGWKKYLYLPPAHRFIRKAPGVDVHIVTQEKD